MARVLGKVISSEAVYVESECRLGSDGKAGSRRPLRNVFVEGLLSQDSLFEIAAGARLRADPGVEDRIRNGLAAEGAFRLAADFDRRTGPGDVGHDDALSFLHVV